MIQYKLWQKILFIEAIKVGLFFLTGFTFLYILIDYSIHAKSFATAQFEIQDICIYYLCQFSQRAAILVPFAILLAVIKVLSSINTKREMLILFSSGISSKKLIKPFILLSFISMSILYVNAEIFIPYAENHLRKIEESYFASKSLDISSRYLSAINMEDGSTFIYQFFDQEKQAFFDTYWIKNESKEILRIKYLYPFNPPKAEYVDIITKDVQGKYFKKESLNEIVLPNLALDKEVIEESKFKSDYASISMLINKYFKTKDKDQKLEISSHLTYKLLMPFLALFVCLIPAPFCLKYSRNIPIFMIFALSIFVFISFITLIDAALIIAQNHVFSPFWSLFILFCMPLIGSITQYNKLRSIL
jgi:lipopolysaccharide export system permease protein